MLAHALSKAGDEGGVQPVGLGDQPFGGAERLDLARIGQGDVELGCAQGGDEGIGVGADRLQGDRVDPALLDWSIEISLVMPASVLS